MKLCPKCHQPKPFSDFHRDHHATSGWTSHCKVCRRAAVAIWRVQSTDRRVSYGKEWREANAEYDRQRKAEWYQKNAESERQRARTWREKNHSKFIALNRDYRKTHPERVRVIQARRRARRLDAGPSYSEEQWEALKRHYERRCLCCGRREPEIRLTPDHVLPLARGGRADISNIQPLCLPCNQRKSIHTTDFRSPLQIRAGELQ